jgi:bifunctional non-homologous end joining protein LigD
MDEITWLRPKVVAEFAFTEWTTEGLLRHGRYVDLRPDVQARSVRRERA